MHHGTSLRLAVADALDGLPLGRFHALLVATLAFACLATSFSDTQTAFLFSGLEREFSASSVEDGIFASSQQAGILIGTAASALQDGQLGRRPAMLFGYIVAAVASGLMCAVHSFAALCANRLLQAAAFSWAHTGFQIWFTEQLPSDWRGPLYCIALLGWPVGKQAMIWMASLVSGTQWRVLVVLSGVLHALAALSVLPLCESPRHLATAGDDTAAISTLRRIYRLNGTPPPASLADVDCDKLLSVPNRCGAASSVHGRLKSLLSGRNRSYITFATFLFAALAVTTLMLDTWGAEHVPAAPLHRFEYAAVRRPTLVQRGRLRRCR